ncbi:LamG domain-containing protein [Candidatus Micrarchaeota archaeon]|nr:LamG domain-containing protein [Candidatus Micrarchaeota archaeon]MBU2476645.1 LamG domain-containing protein [Candidatus Micrarchaeota archaeon]
MKKFIFLPLVLLLFSGCLIQPQVNIKEVSYDGENVSVELYANKEIQAEAKLTNEKREVLCSQKMDLKQGNNLIKAKCDLKEKSVYVEILANGLIFSKLVEINFDEGVDFDETEIEEKVLELAETTLEGEVLGIFERNFSAADECNVEEFIENIQKYYSTALPELNPYSYNDYSNLTSQQKLNLQEQINKTKKCKIKVEKKITEKEKNKFEVSYSLKSQGDCIGLYSQEDVVKIEVDLEKGLAEATEGQMGNSYSSLDQKKFFEALDLMGACLQALLMGVNIPLDPIPVEPTPIEPEPVPFDPDDAVFLHRTTKNCATDEIIKPEEKIQLKDSQGNGLYFNYTCESRKQEQCSFTERKKLVLDLDFDEGQGIIVKDKSENSFEGKVSNPVWVEGFTGKALEFNKTSFVKIPNHSELQMDNYLIQAKIKVTEEINSFPEMYQTILSKENDYILRFANGHDEEGNGRILSSLHFAGSEQHANAHFHGFDYLGGSYEGHETSVINLNPGEWHKLEMEFDGKLLVLRLDGKVISKTQTSRKRTHSSYDLFIGSHVNGINGFVGVIDDVKIWSIKKNFNAEDSYYDEWCEYNSNDQPIVSETMPVTEEIESN